MKLLKPFKTLVLSTFALSLVVGCDPASSSPNMTYPDAYPSPEATSAPMGSELAQLVSENISPEEARLRDVLGRDLQLKFPLKVGIINYSFRSQLDLADQQALFDKVKTKWEDSELIREVVRIPDSLTHSGASVETIRQLAARFQTDIIILLAGEHSFEQAKSQPLNFFDTFGENRYYESSVKLEALVFDVFTGTFLSPFSDAQKSDPVKLDRSDNQFDLKAYDIKKDTEFKLWGTLEDKFLKNILLLEEEVKNQPAPSPTPTPTPSTESEGA